MIQTCKSLLVSAALLTLAACGPASTEPSNVDLANVDATAITAEAIHAHALVLDAHADIEIPGKESRYVGTDGLSKVAPDKMRAGGVDAVVMSVAVGPRATRR